MFLFFDEGISQYQPCGLAFLSQLPRLRRALSLGRIQEAFLSGWAMGRGSRVVFVAVMAAVAILIRREPSGFCDVACLWARAL